MGKGYRQSGQWGRGAAHIISYSRAPYHKCALALLFVVVLLLLLPVPCVHSFSLSIKFAHLLLDNAWYSLSIVCQEKLHDWTPFGLSAAAVIDGVESLIRPSFYSFIVPIASLIRRPSTNQPLDTMAARPLLLLFCPSSFLAPFPSILLVPNIVDEEPSWRWWVGECGAGATSHFIIAFIYYTDADSIC